MYNDYGGLCPCRGPLGDCDNALVGEPCDSYQSVVPEDDCQSKALSYGMMAIGLGSSGLVDLLTEIAKASVKNTPKPSNLTFDVFETIIEGDLKYIKTVGDVFGFVLDGSFLMFDVISGVVQNVNDNATWQKTGWDFIVDIAASGAPMLLALIPAVGPAGSFVISTVWSFTVDVIPWHENKTLREIVKSLG